MFFLGFLLSLSNIITTFNLKQNPNSNSLILIKIFSSCLEFFLQGVSMNFQDPESGDTPLMMAASQNNKQVISLKFSLEGV